MKLDNATRAQYKRALLQAGQTTAGLNDDDLQAAFYALSSTTVHSGESEIIEGETVTPEPVKKAKPKKAKPVDPVEPIDTQQSIDLPNGTPIVINVTAGATLNITIKAA